MKKLLHIIATPRDEESRTLKVSSVFLKSFQESHPGWEVDELNLFTTDLPEMTLARVDGKYDLLSGHELKGHHQKSWERLIEQIERFKGADGYLLSVPMWNFSIPYRLKHYLDIIVQPKYLFQYVDGVPQGLIQDKKIVVITSRGGDYSVKEYAPFDQQEPYLKTVLGFIGLTDLIFIHAQPMDAGGAGVQAEKLDKAKVEAVKIAKLF